MPTQPAKIAVTNQKGGVAKTTLSINVAGATAAAGCTTVSKNTASNSSADCAPVRRRSLTT